MRGMTFDDSAEEPLPEDFRVAANDPEKRLAY